MNITSWILVAVVALLIVYDTYADLQMGYKSTISYDLLSSAQQRPIIAFAVGVVVGHVFWNQGA